jgi:hypothetical protein
VAIETVERSAPGAGPATARAASTGPLPGLVGPRTGWLIAAALLAFAAPFALSHPNSYDGATMMRVAIGIAQHGNPLVRQRFDPFGLNTPYSGYGIALSLVMAPLYLAGRVFGFAAPGLMNLTDALLVAATGVVVFAMLRRRGCNDRLSSITTLVIVFGTPLLAYALTDFSEPGVALMIACAVYALDAVSRMSRVAAYGAGAAAGGAVLFRTDSLPMVAVPVAIALLVLSSDRWTDARRFAIGAASFAVIWMAYNAARFGSPFASGYHNQPFNHGLLPGVYGLLLSPGRGVFVYVPVLLIAVAVIPKLRGRDRVLALLAVTLLVARLLMYATWWSWYAGDVWGPRFLMPVIPAFAPALASGLERWQRSSVVRALIVGGVAIAAIGVVCTVRPAANGYVGLPAAPSSARQFIAAAASPAHLARIDHRMFDWTRFPFGR